MLAKPKYSSPPDEVCCWPERRGRAAGREYHGEEDGGTVAESYREDVAGRGAVAERLQRGGVVAERLAGCAEEVLLARAPLLHHREAATGREVARHHREEIGKNLKSTRKPH